MTTRFAPPALTPLAGVLPAGRRAPLPSPPPIRQANYRLGMERAESVAQRTREIGLASQSLVILSYGQEPTPPNTDEPRNRGVEVIVR